VSTYSEKLKDPRWQKKRLQVMEHAGWMCQLCGSESKQLHVHHPKYAAGREPWDYQNLITLCCVCHERHHSKSIPVAALNTTKAAWICAEIVRGREKSDYVDPLPFMIALDAMAGNGDAMALVPLIK
jgi:hypothetical protein